MRSHEGLSRDTPVCELEYPRGDGPVLDEAVLEGPEERTGAKRLHAGPQEPPGAIQAGAAALSGGRDSSSYMSADTRAFCFAPAVAPLRRKEKLLKDECQAARRLNSRLRSKTCSSTCQTRRRCSAARFSGWQLCRMRATAMRCRATTAPRLPGLQSRGRSLPRPRIAAMGVPAEPGDTSADHIWRLIGPVSGNRSSIRTDSRLRCG